MHVWGGLQEVFGISGNSTGHQNRPQLDIYNSEYEVTHLCEGGSDAERTSCSPQLIHQPVHIQVQTILSSLKEEWSRLLLERGMRDIFSGTEEVSGLTAPIVKTFLERDAISLSRGLGVSSERSPSSGR